jgi:hypothetical protein
MEIFWGLPYYFWLVICIAIATVYLFVVPKAARDPHVGITERLVLKYAHSLVWVLLATACVIANFKFTSSAKMVSLISLGVYIVFIVTLFKTKIFQKNRTL